MGSIIKQVATSNNAFSIFHSGYIQRAVVSCYACIKKAKLNLDSVQLLINTGIYKEDYICEPAVSSLIHNKLSSKFSLITTKSTNKFFSFDMSNGGVGTLQALQVLDNYISNGSISNGMVVSGDTEPIKGNSKNYNYSDGAASIILTQNSNPNNGFRHFKTYHHTIKKNNYLSNTRLTNQKLSLSIKENESFLNDCVTLAKESIDKFLLECNINLNEIDLIVSSQSPKGFISQLRENKAFENKLNKNNKGRLHTSGILFELNNAIKTKKFQTSKNILFVSVGAGITVSLALYKN